MNRMAWGLLAIVMILLGFMYWYTLMSRQQEIIAANQDLARRAETGSADLGTYGYVCEDHTTFTLTFANDLDSVVMRPRDNPSYPDAVMLKPIPAPPGKFGKWFTDNNKYVVIGRAQSVTLNAKGSSPVNCSPAADPDKAPWDWGD